MTGTIVSGKRDRTKAPEPAGWSPPPFSAGDVSLIARAASSAFPVSIPALFPVESAFVGARQSGKRLGAQWFSRVDLTTLFLDVRNRWPGATHWEICIQTGAEHVEIRRLRHVFSNRNRGRIGLQFSLHDQQHRLAPLETIANNRSLEKVFGGFLTRLNLSEADFFARGGSVRALRMRQFFIDIGQGFGCTELFRGNLVASPPASLHSDAETVLDGIRTWFLANQDDDGSIPYKYWPSRKECSTADNPIRRFMATVALARMGEARKDQALMHAARQNLAFNLGRFYRKEGDLGRIEWAGSVKLGALALAGIAVLELGDPGGGRSVLDSLLATVLALRDKDGSFRTFHIPPERNDNQNFYPGEALLFLALLERERPDPELLGLIRESLLHYRGRFLADRNPAFVPWHSQASAAHWERTREPWLLDHVFEMNDWLVQLQQWGSPLDPDLWGRFYEPSHPEYGAPHASSTAVYMEGLADALYLALSRGDAERAGRYRMALARGLRSLKQLQFRAGPEMFYIENPDAVAGAIRTETYNNEIRIDNMQHSAMALLKILALPEPMLE